MLPNFGGAPTPSQAAWELRVSHWKGQLPSFSVGLDPAYRGQDTVFGFLLYRGRPVHGFRSTAQGVPLDSYGRNVYLDTLNSAYGPGWKRQLSFLLARPTGAFCYSLFPSAGGPSGKGQAYRATVIGPGVMPDLTWESTLGAPRPDERTRGRGVTAQRTPTASGLCA
jgi:hypothetical protein